MCIRDSLEPELPEIPPRPETADYERPPREEFRYVPDVAAKLEQDKNGKAKKSKKNKKGA